MTEKTVRSISHIRDTTAKHRPNMICEQFLLRQKHCVACRVPTRKFRNIALRAAWCWSKLWRKACFALQIRRAVRCSLYAWGA